MSALNRGKTLDLVREIPLGKPPTQQEPERGTVTERLHRPARHVVIPNLRATSGTFRFARFLLGFGTSVVTMRRRATSLSA